MTQGGVGAISDTWGAAPVAQAVYQTLRLHRLSSFHELEGLLGFSSTDRNPEAQKGEVTHSAHTATKGMEMRFQLIPLDTKAPCPIPSTMLSFKVGQTTECLQKTT